MELKLFICTLLIAFPSLLFGDTFSVHCRDRHPELYITDQGCGGPVAELAEKLVSDLGHHIRWRAAPWNRTIHEAKYGGVDLLVRHSMNLEREVFLLPLMYSGQWRSVYYFTSSSNKEIISVEQDLNGMTVGQLSGSFYSDDFKKNTRIEKYNVETTSQLIKMLQANRLDAVITSTAHELESFRTAFPNQEQPYVDYFLNGRHFSIPKSSDKSKYINEFRQKLNQYSETGIIKEIYNRHGLEWTFAE